jgi:hypothetical protein
MRVVDLKPDAEMLKEVREYFPHRDVRKYQADLANSVYEALLAGERNIVVEAPTGLGKGPDAVSPNPGALGAGYRGSCLPLASGPPDRPPRYTRGRWPTRRRMA